MTGVGDFEGVAQHQAAKSPCVHCPWRIENQGKRHPSGWYTKANLRRLWSGIRRGGQMSCHPTDPRNPVTDADQAAGYKPAPEGAVLRECAGSVILVQRELHVLNHLVEKVGDVAAYFVTRRGLTKEGALIHMGRAVMTWPGDVPMRRDHNLDEPVSTGKPNLDTGWRT